MDNFIQREIERLRKDLHKVIVKEKNLSSPKVVELSQKLDRILNSYEDSLNKKSTSKNF